MSDAEKKYRAVGKAREKFDTKSVGKFQTDLYNLAYLRDQATKRNKIYLVIIILLIAALTYICMTAKFKTYVVRVNDSTGEVSSGVELKARAYNPQQVEIQFFLREFVRNARSVPNDLVVYRKNLQKASYFLTSEAAKKYQNLLIKEGRTLDKIQGQMIEPTISTLQLQPGMDRTYQIRWIEETFSGNGPQTRASYSGLFTVTVEPPTTEALLQVNPLGLKIVDLVYQKESEAVMKKGAEAPAEAMPSVNPLVDTAPAGAQNPQGAQ